MADATVAVDLAQSLDVQGDVSAQITFDVVLVDLRADFLYFLFRQVFYTCVWIDTGSLQNFIGSRSADTVNVCQADLHSFFSW